MSQSSHRNTRQNGFAVCAAALIITACASGPEPAPAPVEAAPEPAPRYEPPPQKAPAPAEPQVMLAPRHPARHTVVRGDTLWDISAMFLRDPWLWPEIWHVNPQINNPHLIYPGDVITLIYVDGRPQLRLERAQASTPPRNNDVRLSPQVRVEPLDRAITTIPYDVISPFLSRPSILSKKQAKAAPYVLAIKESHLMAGEGFHLYVRGKGLFEGTNFAIYNIGDEYRDPDNNDVLGFEALFVGQGRVVREGDPATVLVTESRREALAGDRLLPMAADIPLNFFPAAPDSDVAGRIIDVIDGVGLIGQYQIVALNRGTKHGLNSGHVLEIFQAGEVVEDRFRRATFGRKKVTLPEERAGTLMVFKSLEDISFALIMNATSEIRVLDIVRNP